MFTKVKAAFIMAGVAALAGVAGVVAELDWGQFGSFGPAIGAFVAAGVAWLVREVTGYGNGVPKQ
jgi:hypothetical protein